jgi:hypothetical protein
MFTQVSHRYPHCCPDRNLSASKQAQRHTLSPSSQMRHSPQWRRLSVAPPRNGFRIPSPLCPHLARRARPSCSWQASASRRRRAAWPCGASTCSWRRGSAASSRAPVVAVNRRSCAPYVACIPSCRAAFAFRLPRRCPPAHLHLTVPCRGNKSAISSMPSLSLSFSLFSCLSPLSLFFLHPSLARERERERYETKIQGGRGQRGQERGRERERERERERRRK